MIASIGLPSGGMSLTLLPQDGDKSCLQTLHFHFYFKYVMTVKV